jgi:hypothetical protein
VLALDVDCSLPIVPSFAVVLLLVLAGAVVVVSVGGAGCAFAVLRVWIDSLLRAWAGCSGEGA